MILGADCAHFPRGKPAWEGAEAASGPICRWVTLGELCLALSQCFLSSEAGLRDEPHTPSAMHWGLIWVPLICCAGHEGQSGDQRQLTFMGSNLCTEV